jgi:hypothetical protein
VQIFVVPRIQVNTRWRDRWEQDVIELTALIEEELPRVLNGYRSASIGPRIAVGWLEDPKVDRQKAEELLSDFRSEQRKAEQVVGEKMARLGVLERRIRRMHPYAAYWQLLARQRLTLKLALWDVEPWRIEASPPPDDETWDASWAKIADKRKALFELVLQIADPLKPPPARSISRLRSGIPRPWRREKSGRRSRN